MGENTKETKTEAENRGEEDECERKKGGKGNKEETRKIRNNVMEAGNEKIKITEIKTNEDGLRREGQEGDGD
jgi:hypothetical protein